MTTSADWRGLCRELANELQGYKTASPLHDRSLLHRARAALAAEADGPAVPDGREPASIAAEPSDEELLALMPKDMRDEFSYAAKVCSDATGGQVKPGIFRVCLNRTALDFARAVLSRWGRPAPAPAEGEVGVPECERNWVSILSPSGGYELREDAALCDGAQLVGGEWWAPVFGCDSLESALSRIRERLERQAAPVPVAVSERLPGPEDVCAKLRYCWWWNQEQDVWMYGDASHADHAVYTHWLPAHALPLPGVEVDE